MGEKVLHAIKVIYQKSNINIQQNELAQLFK